MNDEAKKTDINVHRIRDGYNQAEISFIFYRDYKRAGLKKGDTFQPANSAACYRVGEYVEVYNWKIKDYYKGMKVEIII